MFRPRSVRCCLLTPKQGLFASACDAQSKPPSLPVSHFCEWPHRPRWRRGFEENLHLVCTDRDSNSTTYHITPPFGTYHITPPHTITFHSDSTTVGPDTYRRRPLAQLLLFARLLVCYWPPDGPGGRGPHGMRTLDGCWQSMSALFAYFIWTRRPAVAMQATGYSEHVGTLNAERRQASVASRACMGQSRPAAPGSVVL